MASQKMEALVLSGKVLKASAAEQGHEMLPMLYLATATEALVLGLAVGKERWSEIFSEVRREHRPREVALTTDAAFKPGTDLAVRPLEDPAATHCLMVMRATATKTEIALVPYVVNDAGGIEWEEARTLHEHGLFGSMLVNLREMVRP